MKEYLIDHWSISAVQEFIRNEKSFERRYIFGIRDVTMSLSQIIGITYHKALMAFFWKYKKEKEIMSYDELSQVAFGFLTKIGANKYRPQAKKTIEQQQIEAHERINFAIKNFLSEFDAYESEIKQILYIEETFEVNVSINDIEIPVPLKIVPDIVFINHDDELCILDHKAKKNWSREDEITLRYGNQAIGYALGIKAATGWNKEVKKFFFYENKYTQNRNKARQIKQIPLNIEEEGALLEQILFEAVHRMIQAVGDPDYVYLMNPHDYFQDSGEITEFWIKTHIEGLEGFPNLPKKTKMLLSKKRDLVRRSALSALPNRVIKSYTKPKQALFYNSKDMETMSIEARIEHRLSTFNYLVQVAHKIDGYSCDTYLLKVAAGMKTATIHSYRLDIANAIGVKDVRIAQNLVEYKDDVYVAVEINKKNRRFLSLDQRTGKDTELLIGEDNFGQMYSWDIGNPSTPHMMISGASGSGKSETLKTILLQAQENNMKVIILDPKYEFSQANGASEILHDQEEIEFRIAFLVEEMDEIYKSHGVHGHTNKKTLVIFDEAADCFARQQKIKGMRSLEDNTLILSQKARSAGIHLVLVAQRFSTKILTGDAKANYPVRLCMTASSGIDSKVMLGVEGAEKLNGKGDGLFQSPGIPEPVRIQCYSI